MEADSSGCVYLYGRVLEPGIFAALVKSADTTIQQLLKAKERSDLGDYAGKQAILRQLIAASPADFYVDSQQGRFYGWTHRPTGFRFHLPVNAQAAPSS